jgi:hypothetical protein
MAHDGGIVWVLGAGFSKALGGPLFTDLLSSTMRKDLDVRYPHATLGDEHARRVRLVVEVLHRKRADWVGATGRA